MGERKVFVLAHPEARRRALAFVAEAPQGFCVEVKEPTRSLEQNAALWAFLGEIATAVDWYGQKLTAAEWKDVFSAALKQQKVVPGLEGGFVVLGSSTSKMSKSEMSDLLELISAFAANHGVGLAAA